ncbi:MAG TPA: glucuronate isomerase, partial [Chloroflexi bacterium]|nr:glucuronate isomerase [Chloroflexota bacterium]
MNKFQLHPDRYFSPDPGQRAAARELYAGVKDLPLICPHGHVDPRLFADPAYQFGSPTELLLVPDHYVFRMLYSQGIELEKLGVRKLGNLPPNPLPPNPRDAWQLFADNFHLFRGTPTGIWLTDEFANVFDITEKLNSANAQEIYDQIDAQLKSPEFQPRRMFERFNIEVLCTTDAASDTLEYHQQIRDSGWQGQIRPTFRPDAVVNLDFPGWKTNLEKLEQITHHPITSYPVFISALENRRAFFKSMGATATDHAALTALTLKLAPEEAEAIFQRALKGEATPADAASFTAHLLVEMARMSAEDGLVMQLHVGSYRDHNPLIAAQFGRDMGADIPIRSEFTQNLKPLLDRFGTDPRLTLILFNLDETTYARELAPLAGHYPALKLGPPWWFHDSPEGMLRFREQTTETAGFYNTVGFNDDTRAFPSIPARHDVWRRAGANWLAGLVARHFIDKSEAREMIQALAYGLAK